MENVPWARLAKQCEDEQWRINMRNGETTKKYLEYIGQNDHGEYICQQKTISMIV